MSKADNLQAAHVAGLAVPTFFVVPHDINEAQLGDFIDEHIASSDMAGERRFSVRSSANVEDSASQSFAGQFDSFLHIARHDLAAKVIECRAACNKKSVAAYARKVHSALEMDVIIQRMVDSDISGVVFTANPNGMLNEAVISVSHGAGTAVTDDTVATTYYYHLDDNIFYYEQSDNAPILKEKLLSETIRLARQCMELFGRYIDMEIAVADDTLWLLQVRPITTIDTQRIVVFDNNNLVESYPGISLPLTQSFVAEAYTKIFTRLIERTLGKRAAKRYTTLLSHMVRPLNGRMYYQVSSWSDILQLLPMRRTIIPMWQEMVGVDTQAAPQQVKARVTDRCRILLSICGNTILLPRRINWLHRRFTDIDMSFRQLTLTSLSRSQLLAQYDIVTNEILQHWDLTLANDLYAFVWTGIYRRAAGQHAPLIGDKELPSARVSTEFNRLARALRRSELLEMNTSELHHVLAVPKTQEASALAAYINDYGDRAPEELKLESLTFRTNPELLTARLAAHVGTKHARRQTPDVPHETIISRWLRARAAAGVYHREQSRLDRTRIYGIVRSLMLEIGERLATDGAIDTARDVFYLTLDELRAHGTVSFSDTVDARKVHYDALAGLPAYTRLVFPADSIIEKPLYARGRVAFSSEYTLLHGTPCSPGIAEGEAVIIHDATTTQDLTGKIIIAETTDPGWVFILSQAAGIVVERGSLLSHTAIVSRELRLPSVVGVTNATCHITNGDRIRIDGVTGTVEVIS